MDKAQIFEVLQEFSGEKQLLLEGDEPNQYTFSVDGLLCASENIHLLAHAEITRLTAETERLKGENIRISMLVEEAFSFGDTTMAEWNKFKTDNNL